MFRELQSDVITRQAAVRGRGHPLLGHGAANFAIVCSEGDSGATLSGTAVDEQFVYALGGGVIVSAGGHSEMLGREDLAILPPGEWTILFERPGLVIQQITADEALAKRAPNASVYEQGAPEVAGVCLARAGGRYRLSRYSRSKPMPAAAWWMPSARAS